MLFVVMAPVLLVVQPVGLSFVIMALIPLTHANCNGTLPTPPLPMLTGCVSIQPPMAYANLVLLAGQQ
jgi:hypothetical protein